MPAHRKTSTYKAVHFADKPAKLPKKYDVTETPRMRSNMPYAKKGKQETDS